MKPADDEPSVESESDVISERRTAGVTGEGEPYPFWAWFLWAPLLAIGLIFLLAGVWMFVTEVLRVATFLLLGFGMFMVSAVRTMIRRTREGSDSASGSADDEELADEFIGEEGNDLWRIPGYGTDAEERPEEHRGDAEPDSDDPQADGDR